MSLYNHERPHSMIKYKTPCRAEEEFTIKHGVSIEYHLEYGGFKLQIFCDFTFDLQLFLISNWSSAKSFMLETSQIRVFSA